MTNDDILACVPEKVRQVIEPSGSHLLWRGKTMRGNNGAQVYGWTDDLPGAETVYAHRAVMWAATGGVPDRLRHICPVPLCVQPLHWEDSAKPRQFAKARSKQTNVGFLRALREEIDAQIQRIETNANAVA